MCGLLLVGCAGPTGRVHHDDFGSGPLSAQSGGGNSSVYAPKKKPWYANWGDFLLCAREAGDEIVLQSVVYEVDPEPLEVKTYLRTVRPDEIKFNDDGTPSDESLPFISAEGRPPAFNYGEPQAGTFTSRVKGHRITQSCKDVDDREANGYTALVVAMKVGEQGGRIPTASINYTVNGREYALDLEWAMTGCGTKTTTPRELCEGGR
ncbi:hypothetical protein [Streptomyces sp. CC219B]|uniref:hypothetical protein n=1 Tax=Streptomyces sp. CC219B TaxID=3044574 RepID=UPI0024A86F34|nr:hypothetical protein [Streptomyces sp. CC219B]